MTREEAIRHLHTFSTTMGSGQTSDEQHKEAKRMAIEALQAKVEWIPCSERLPKTGDSILVTFSDEEVGIVWSARPKAWGKYEKANNLIFPVAWMPLPDPWNGGEEE